MLSFHWAEEQTRAPMYGRPALCQLSCIPRPLHSLVYFFQLSLKDYQVQGTELDRGGTRWIRLAAYPWGAWSLIKLSPGERKRCLGSSQEGAMGKILADDGWAQLCPDRDITCNWLQSYVETRSFESWGRVMKRLADLGPPIPSEPRTLS